MLAAIANSLGPVCLVMSLGWALRQRHFLSDTTLQGMNRLTYWVGVPCLLFSKIAAMNPALGNAGNLLLITAVATGAGALAAYAVARCFALPRRAVGTFLQAAFRGNLAFVGLPVILYAFSGGGRNPSQAETAVFLVIGPMVVLYNIGAVLALLLSRDGVTGRALVKLMKELVLNPLLIACVAGALWAASGWPLPTLLARSLAAVGQMALPLAMICIGGTLVTIQVRSRPAWPLAAALIKVALMPLIGYVMAWGLGLGAEDTRMVLILLACPTAAVSYVLVRQLGGDEDLAAGSILLSTVLAGFSLALILALPL